MRVDLFLVSFAFLLSSITYGQLNHIEIPAIITDPKIDIDYIGGDTVKHQVFINQSVTHNNKLLLFLPGTGGRLGKHYTEFCKVAAHEGYYTIGLVYKNTTSISGLCGFTTDPLCSENARKEIIYGTDLSAGVSVDTANSIINRFSKLLFYLATNYPSWGWKNYIDTITLDIQWEKIALASHSQGGGMPP